MAAPVRPGAPTSTATYSTNPTSNAPQSQLSAPVLEFRCMFTHDILKKSKKWHDGSLRFHTFNRRVMVYDDAKNLVGHLHYRQTEDFGEGLELQLDRPVLVQVEEPLGLTDTDLTPLLARQRHDSANHSSHPPQPTRATLSRINAANSQLRPKSIKELLGASQGTLGRARLPIQSPFDQRQALSDRLPTAEPTAKRRKISPGKENEPVPTPVASRSVPSKPPRLAGPIVDISSDDEPTAVLGPPPPNDALVRERERQPKPADQNHEDSVSLDSRVSSKKNHTLTKQKSATTNEKVDEELAEPAPGRLKHPIGHKPDERRPEKPLPQRAETLPKKPRTDQPSELSAPMSASASTLRPRSSSATSLQSQRRFPTGPRSSLKFGSHPSRPKLMYKALLLATQKENAHTSDASFTRTPLQDALSHNAQHPGAPPGRRRRTDLLDTDSFFAASQIAQETAAAATQPHDTFAQETEQVEEDAAPPYRHHLHQPSEQPLPEDVDLDHPTSEAHSDAAPDSPLFMPRTASQMTPMPSQAFNENDHSLPCLPQEVAQHVSSFPVSSGPQSPYQRPRSAAPQSPRHFGQQIEAQLPPSFGFGASKSAWQTSSNEAAAAKLAVSPNLQPKDLDSSTVRPSALSHPVSKVKQRLFRRVVSEQLPTKTLVSDDLLVNADLNEALDLLSDSPLQLTPAKAGRNDALVPPAKLQRAASDPVALDSAVTMHDPVPSPDTPPQQVQAHPVPAAELQSVPPPAAADAGPWTTTEAFLLFDWWPPGKQKPDYGQGTHSGPTGVGTIEDSATIAMKAVANKKYGMFGSARLVSQR